MSSPPPSLPAAAAPPAAVRPALPTYRPGAPGRPFVVALCGSAGSLEAIEQFFACLPPRSGLAYVLVTHQPPAPGGRLAQVVQGFTALPVADAADGLRVRPDHVYVAPAGHDLSLLHGCLFLLPPAQPAARRRPIDFFLQALAHDAGERAVCIIFSGGGTDGSQGLKLVTENFGTVMVQDPETAAFDGMPRAALATGFVDFVLPAAQLPVQLLAHALRLPAARPAREPADSTAQPAHVLQKIFLLIRSQTGHDFSLYKRNTVFRRIERRMNAHQINDFAHYVRYLQENPAEVGLLFRELLIGVTKFFRDADAFASLQQQLRPLLEAKPAHGTVRVWAPGCSTGEEAYSLAMVLLESFDALGPGRHLRLQIFATDISAESIEAARHGRYPAGIAAAVGPERLARFFRAGDGHYEVRREVRDAVVFAQHDLNKDAPFTRLDLLCCRNLLIYFSAELQKKLLPVFHYALLPGGLLFLGPSENMTGFHDLFQPVDAKWKISQSLATAALPTRLVQFPFATARRAPAAAAPPDPPLMPTAAHRPDGSFAALVQKTLLTTYTPPAVVIDAAGEILYVNGRTGRYLEPAPGPSGLNLFEMARDVLRFEVSGAVHRALQTHDDVVVEGVRVQTDGGQQLLRLSVRHLGATGPLAGLLLVAFEDQPTPRRVRRPPAGALLNDQNRDAVVAALDEELRHTKRRLQTIVEDMESSLEELKSANEELQSANEELQSANEEAMTNKEELQSMNEELLSLNMQYEVKAEELAQTANDMKNLLDATEIATIFLDNDLLIKRFTPPVARIVPLVPGDVGRPMAHFASNLRYDHLLRDVQEVLDRLTSAEVNLQTTGGEWYTMRILPYRSLDNYINGAVITFTDVSALKDLEGQLQETVRFAESIQETVHEPLVTLDAGLRVYLANHAFAGVFGTTPAALRGQPLALLSGGAWNQPALLHELARLLDPAAPADRFDDLALTADFAGLGRRVVLYGRLLRHQGQLTARVLLGVQAVEAVA